MTYSSSFFEQIVPDSLASARIVVPLVKALLKPSRVVDVGCATGAWLSVFLDCGVDTIVGLDGEYVNTAALLIPAESFRPTDLSRPFPLSDRFDLALSLEVAEHLPGAAARGFVQSLCQLAPVVLFSAAVPGQGGTHHINEQWPEYWRRLFAENGFRMFDPFRPALWHEERVVSYYRQNLFLFIRNDVVDATPAFSDLPEIKDDRVLMVIEPYILFGPRATLARLPRLLWSGIKRRLSDG